MAKVKKIGHKKYAGFSEKGRKGRIAGTTTGSRATSWKRLSSKGYETPAERKTYRRRKK